LGGEGLEDDEGEGVVCGTAMAIGRLERKRRYGYRSGENMMIS
jgi:hypothetical protein